MPGEYNPEILGSTLSVRDDTLKQNAIIIIGIDREILICLTALANIFFFDKRGGITYRCVNNPVNRISV